MRRNPVYVFKDGTSTGINEVPLESIIQVVSYNGDPNMSQLVKKDLLNQSTTIAQYLAIPSAYKELDRYIDNLNEISDVNLDGIIVDGDVLRFDGTNWTNDSVSSVAGDITLGDLGDVTAPVLSNDGQYLKWDSGSHKWVYMTPVLALNDLNDVTTTPLANQFLSYDDGSSEWVAVDIDGGSFQNRFYP